MGDDLKLMMAYLPVGNREYERKSIWSQYDSNSRMSAQDTFFQALACKSSHELSNFLAAHSKLNIERCILSQRKGRGFENFSGG